MKALKILFVTVSTLFIFDQCGLWLERRGYFYWRHKKPKSSGAGNALMEMGAMFNPGVKHTVEAIEKKDVHEHDEQKDDTDKLLFIK